MRSVMVMAAVVSAALMLFPSGEVSARDFQTWLSGVRQEALAKGVSQATVSAALPDSLRPIPRVIELDRKQPEKIRTLDQYLASVVSAERKEKGRARYLSKKEVLKKIEETYGVDPAVVVALWGVETSYGKITGGYNIVNALATLAYDGRRSAFFRDELIKALKIADQGHVKIENLKGSWAGAMGQCQFMPSSFLRYAVDYNGDGRRDIWGTESDVFASAANYLAKSGWKRGQTWGHEVKLPKGFNRSLFGTDKEHSLSFWRTHDVRGLNGAKVADSQTLKASLIQPDGAGGRSFLIYENYKVILKWNRSTYFATAVGLLSDHIRTGKSAAPAKRAKKHTAAAPAPKASVVRDYND